MIRSLMLAVAIFISTSCIANPNEDKPKKQVDLVELPTKAVVVAYRYFEQFPVKDVKGTLAEFSRQVDPQLKKNKLRETVKVERKFFEKILQTMMRDDLVQSVIALQEGLKPPPPPPQPKPTEKPKAKEKE